MAIFHRIHFIAIYLFLFCSPSFFQMVPATRTHTRKPMSFHSILAPRVICPLCLIRKRQREERGKEGMCILRIYKFHPNPVPHIPDSHISYVSKDYQSTIRDNTHCALCEHGAIENSEHFDRSDMNPDIVFLVLGTSIYHP